MQIVSDIESSQVSCQLRENRNAGSIVDNRAIRPQALLPLVPFLSGL